MTILSVQEKLAAMLHEMDVEAFNALRGQHADVRFDFSEGRFDHHALEGVHLFNCRLRNVNFYFSDLSSAVFCGSDLTGANLEFAFLIRTIFGPPELVNADLAAGLQSYISKAAVLDEVNFQKATLFNACMRECRMTNANFTLAKIKDLDVRHANCQDAIF
jgi:uncharacterized protein YjbI with pentapeptide repeats